MDDESIELLSVMSLTGWEAVENDDGKVIMFLHGNGGIVPFDVALAHWHKDGATPLPFVQVLTGIDQNAECAPTSSIPFSQTSTHSAQDDAG